MSGFGRERVRRGVQYFLAGKVVSAAAGFSATVLVVRGLSVAEFAAYSVLVALVEVFTALSGMGLSHVILRYVPELFSRDRMASLRLLVRTTLALRTGVLLLGLLAAALAAAPLARLLALDDHLAAFRLFLLVVGLRTTSHSLSQVLDSTLHQGVSQLAFSSAALLRCAGMAWLVANGHASLLHVIALEALCDGLACLVLGAGLVRLLHGAGGASGGEPEEWARDNLRPIGRFAMAAYAQHLATLPFGSNTNRLVGGVMFGDQLMAGFGFAQSLYEYAKRYLPTQLLVGVIRPVIVARYTADGNFQRVARLCEQSFQVNLALLLIIATPVAVSGAEILALISAGKYGQASAWILLALLALLALETRRVLVEVLAQTVERYDLMIRSNLLLSSSVLLGILAYPWLGAVAFPLGNAAALIVANRAVGTRLAELGFAQAPDRRATAVALVIFAAATGCGLLARSTGLGWLPAAALALVVHGALFMLCQWTGLRSYARELLGSR